MKRLLSVLLGALSFQAGMAAPPPPLEDDLVRAETVYVGRLVSKNDEKSLTFDVVTVLRGKTVGRTILTCEECPKTTVGALYLLISQGDNRYGKPRDVVGRPMDCQGVWCGWLIMPVTMVDGQQFVERILSSAGGEPASDGAKGLRMERVASLIERFPYNSRANDNTGSAVAPN